MPQDSVIFDNPVFTLLRPDHTTSIPRVLASSVGQVVSADGNYSIVNDDVTYSTNMIYDGDTIELAADSRLSFMVDGHQAYIVGPASVHISIDGDGYRFTMIDGEFLEVFSSRNPAGSSLTVQMRDIILAHNAHDTTMKVQLSADASGDTIVKNYADSVVVARVDDVTDMKDLAPETQLTIAPSTSLASATEAKFSLTDIAFVSDSSSVVNE
ncbi:MAG: hypothetical protein H6766_06815 [Candidatus Peribacteria bacterium]|nr:MAG: hypothetical protein H6766_06815 [Candidatus Peribacteria bacterium]